MYTLVMGSIDLYFCMREVVIEVSFSSCCLAPTFFFPVTVLLDLDRDADFPLVFLAPPLKVNMEVKEGISWLPTTLDESARERDLHNGPFGGTALLPSPQVHNRASDTNDVFLPNLILATSLGE